MKKNIVMCCFLVVICSVMELHAQMYTITDLGMLRGENGTSEALGISESGRFVVGVTDLPVVSDQHAFIWDAFDQEMKDIGTFGGYGSIAYGVNDAGQVVGASTRADGKFEFPFIWDATEGMNDFVGGSYVQGMAYGINNSGKLCGNIYLHDPTTAHGCPYVFTLDSTSTDGLQIFTDYIYSHARDMNSSGQLATTYAKSAHRATGTAWESLGTLRDGNACCSSAFGINNRGQVVGYSHTDEYNETTTQYLRHAFFWDGTTMHDLGTLGGKESMAYDVNDDGIVVGVANNSTSGKWHAFRWDAANGMQDLEDLVVDMSQWTTFISAYAINNAGHIAGSGRTANDDIHAFLLTPAPDVTTTTVPGTSTTTTMSGSTTTTPGETCPVEQIYGTASCEAVFLRCVRDTILNGTPEGQELTRLYYQLSPVIVRAMEENEDFAGEVKSLIEGALLHIDAGLPQ